MNEAQKEVVKMIREKTKKHLAIINSNGEIKGATFKQWELIKDFEAIAQVAVYCSLQGGNKEVTRLYTEIKDKLTASGAHSSKYDYRTSWNLV